MTTRIHRLLAACAAAAIVVPTVALAQQPTMLQLYNLNGSAVGGRWLVRPPATPNTGGPYTITLPNASGTLLTGTGTPGRMSRFISAGVLGDASLDDDYAGTLSRTGNIHISAITGTFQVSSTGLSIAANGDISDGNSAVVINDAQGLDMSNFVIANIGAAGTDFSGTGGLTLADALTVSAGGANITGASNINSLTINASGDIADNNSAVVISDPQGLDMSNFVIANIGAAGTDFSGTGGLTLADALTVSAGGANITGATSINNTGAALTTTIGNIFAGNSLTVNSATVNMANLPAGAATDALITTDGTALRETSVSTMISGLAWMIGTNTITGASTTRSIGIATQAGSEDAFQIQTDGTARLTFGGTGGMTALTTLDMSNNAISNIGAAGTDFSATGGLTLADALTVSAGGATITGATSINNSAAALTTTIGDPTVGNTVSINSATVNMANLPAGAATDELITTDGTALRATAASTIIGNTAWLIGNNTFTAASATRTIGINAQAGSEDALAIQTDGVARMTFGGTGGITASTALTIDAATNQLVLDAGANTITINVSSPSANRLYTIPDASADADFVLTEGTQTINTNLTLEGDVIFQTGTLTVSSVIQGQYPFDFEGSTIDGANTRFRITNPTAPRTITFPNSDGDVHVGAYGTVTITDPPGAAAPVTFTINNTAVQANSVITVTLEDGTDNGFYMVKVGNIVAITSFDVTLSAALGDGLTKIVHYTIINP